MTEHPHDRQRGGVPGGNPARRRWLAAGVAALVTTVTGGLLVSATAGESSAGCSAAYQVVAQWPRGFVAEVTVTNYGEALAGWTLEWALASGQGIVQAWNATVTVQGGRASARNMPYNAGVSAGATVGFGFVGTWTSSNPVPSSFSLNGMACTGKVPTAPGPTPTTPATSPTNPTATPTASAPSATAPEPTAPVSAPAGPGGGKPVTVQGRQAENLDRGVASVRSGSANLVSWRLLGTDPSGVGFNVYRSGRKLNAAPITASTNYRDDGGPSGASYTVKAVVGGVEQGASAASLNLASGYLDVPISPPAGGTTPDGVKYTYAANDASVGDLDGDGKYEIVLKWDPTNAKDNSHSGYTGNVFVDAYQLDGRRLWRIDLGRNIRAGAHYTQFQVFDYDGDGRAEVAMKTSDATVDGAGKAIGTISADYRNAKGYVLSGPEYLTMFDGRTGAALSTMNYDPPRGKVSDWGDSYGNRVDRFLAGTAYLDGTHPSLVMSRGYYTRTVITTWDFRNGALVERWKFDSIQSGSQYEGQGNHQLSVADVDSDGKDEIVFGGMCLDDTGAPLWNTRTGHGDALHVGDLIPSRPGLEVFKVNEGSTKPSSWMADARTGKILWSTPAKGDNGRGVSDNVSAASPGAESWSASDSTLRNTAGRSLGREPGSMNFLVYWDGDPTRELLDRTRIDKYGTGGETRLLTASGVHSNNGTKATPSLSGDLFGDWREEVIWPTSGNTALRVYSTPTPTQLRFTTLMHDSMYRVAIAWQNTSYNQPPHLSYLPGS